MTQGRFSAWPAVFANALTCTDVINSDFSPGINEIAEMVGGTLDVGARAVASRDLLVKLTLLHLTHLATVSPTVGLAVSGQTLIQHQKRADGGAFAGTGHVTLKFMKGFLYPESIEAQQDSNTAARLILNFMGLYDGTNQPMTPLSQALSGTPAAAPTLYRLGPTYINDTLVEANRMARVNFGIEVKATRGNGEEVARECSVYSRKPQISIEPTDLETVIITLTNGTQQRLSGNVVQYFRREGVAFGTAEHIRVTLTRPTAEVGNVAASVGDDPRPGLILKATAGDTIAISTTATIP